MFKLKGLKSVERQIRNIERNNEKAINKGIKETARLILNSALGRVPVDMGVLKASLGIENITEQMVSKVFADAAYSGWVEFGSGPFTEVPNGLEDTAMEWFRTGNGHGHPQPFLFNSMAEHQEKLGPLIEAELIKLLRK